MSLLCFTTALFVLHIETFSLDLKNEQRNKMSMFGVFRIEMQISS